MSWDFLYLLLISASQRLKKLLFFKRKIINFTKHFFTMKKLLFIIGFLFVSLAASSQSLSNDIYTIEKRYGKIVNAETNKKIHKTELQLILDEESYDTYIKARRQHIASIPLWVLTGSGAALSATCFIAAYNINKSIVNESSDLGKGISFAFCYVGGIMFSISTVTFAIPSTILTICSNKNLNEVVENYNNSTSDITLNFGTTNNGIGLMLKF